jgi:hypothetical protein
MATDPVHAAIAARKAAVAHLYAVGEQPGVTEPEEVAASLAEADAMRVLLHTVPTTPAGLLAYVKFISDCEDAGDNVLATVMDNTTATQVMLATIIVALEQLAASEELTRST